MELTGAIPKPNLPTNPNSSKSKKWTRVIIPIWDTLRKTNKKNLSISVSEFEYKSNSGMQMLNVCDPNTKIELIPYDGPNKYLVEVLWKLLVSI